MKFLKDYNRPADLPQKLPVFPLPGALLLPRADLPLILAFIRDLAEYERLLDDVVADEAILERALNAAGVVTPPPSDGSGSN